MSEEIEYAIQSDLYASGKFIKMYKDLQQENKQLKEKIDILLEDNNQLEEIRIKAIEYIKYNLKSFIYSKEYKDLMEILGENENE